MEKKALPLVRGKSGAIHRDTKAQNPKGKLAPGFNDIQPGTVFGIPSAFAQVGTLLGTTGAVR